MRSIVSFGRHCRSCKRNRGSQTRLLFAISVLHSMTLFSQSAKPRLPIVFPFPRFAGCATAFSILCVCVHVCMCVCVWQYMSSPTHTHTHMHTHTHTHTHCLFVCLFVALQPQRRLGITEEDYIPPGMIKANWARKVRCNACEPHMSNADVCLHVLNCLHVLLDLCGLAARPRYSCRRCRADFSGVG